MSLNYKKFQEGNGSTKDIQMRYFLVNIMVIGLSVALLTHFGLIAYYGKVVISEPNPVILALEVIGLIGLIVFAFLNLRRKPL